MAVKDTDPSPAVKHPQSTPKKSTPKIDVASTSDLISKSTHAPDSEAALKSTSKRYPNSKAIPFDKKYWEEEIVEEVFHVTLNVS